MSNSGDRHTCVVLLNGCPFPPQHGKHQRYLQLLRSVDRAGYKLHILGTSYRNMYPWDEKGLAELRSLYGTGTTILSGKSKFDWVIECVYWIFNRLVKPLMGRARRSKRKPTDVLPRKRGYGGGLKIAVVEFAERIKTGESKFLHRVFWSPPSLTNWFAQQVFELRPSVVVINGVFQSDCIDQLRKRYDASGLKHPKYVVDTHDLVSERYAIQRGTALEGGGLGSISTFPEALLSVDFWRQFPIKSFNYEIGVYSGYDRCIMINALEAKVVGKELPVGCVEFAPLVYEESESVNSYREPPVFVGAQSVVNLQALAFYVRRIVPLFEDGFADLCPLQVVGKISEHIDPNELGLRQIGFVDDLDEKLRNCRFFVCPLLHGTGQQVKIVQAMACGLPVVCLEKIASGIPIAHNVDGMVAKTEEEFAQYVEELWENPERCREMGMSARNKIRSWRQEDRLTKVFKSLLVTQADS